MSQIPPLSAKPAPRPSSSPHSWRAFSTSQMMQRVILACLPGLAALTWFFGWGTFINVIWLSLWALGLEALIVWLRGRNIRHHLSDCSALVTAVLLGLALPPSVPWWLSLCGIVAAIVLAKHLFGGMGYNPFNPAMVGYVVLLISFPVAMSSWISPRSAAEVPPDFLSSFQAIFGFLPGQGDLSAYTGATALDEFKLQRGALTAAEFRQQSPLFGKLSGIGWEWVNIAFLCGGLYLLWKKIISWHIPVAMLASLALLAALFHDGGSSAGHGSPFLHLFGGATMLGAFFIATDPVSAATTLRGKLIFGALIGGLTYIIRAWGNYPDGLAFAVLLGNFAAPMLDYFTQPRTFGHRKT